MLLEKNFKNYSGVIRRKAYDIDSPELLRLHGAINV